MPRRPHLIVLMTDQHRFDSLGAYGDHQCDTPNLDALAEESVIFDRHYTSCPLCVPARTSLATGMWPSRTGVIVNYWIPEEARYGTLRPQFRTLYERFAESGYRVAQIGVQHVNCDPPLPQRVPGGLFVGHDQYRQYMAEKGLALPSDKPYRAPCPDFVNGNMVAAEYTTPKTGIWPHAPEHYYDQWIARQTVEFLEQADPDQPLLLFANCWSPHCPLWLPQPYAGMYDPAGIDLPANVGQWYPGQSAMQLVNLPGFMGAAVSLDDWRKAWAIYLVMETMVEKSLGQIIAALKRRGFWDDALVIFSPDHGEMLGAHRMWQKMCMYEESIRTPTFIKPPRMDRSPAAGRVTGLTSHVDLMNTMYDYAGIGIDGASDGLSLRPLIEGSAAKIRDEVFSEFNGNAGRGSFSRAIITDRYKFVYCRMQTYTRAEYELYDRQADPLESRNLAADPAHRSIRADLAHRLARWMASTGDTLPFEAPL
jgi:arylsulfatase A-like enzyme